jgi:hypothetical protein
MVQRRVDSPRRKAVGVMTKALIKPPPDVQSAVAALIEACRNGEPTDVPVDEPADPLQPFLWSNATLSPPVRGRRRRAAA